MRPRLQVVISGAVRNVDTFETFRSACREFIISLLVGFLVTDMFGIVRSKFAIAEVDFEPKPIREQESLFYATAVPLKILSIRGPP